MHELRMLGNNIRRFRKAQLMTQEELAYDAAISVSYLRRMESGNCNPSYKVLSSIAYCLSIDVTELMKKSDQQSAYPPACKCRYRAAVPTYADNCPYDDKLNLISNPEGGKI